MSSPADGSKALRRGAPELRPALGHCVLSLNPSMSARDNEYRGRSLMETVEGLRPPVSPEDLVKALEANYAIRSRDILIEVCAPPTDFMVTFRSASECTIVFKDSPVLCQGVSVSLARWHPGWGTSESSELPFLTKLSFDALPRRAWDLETVKELLNFLDGELVKIFPPKDSWCLSVIAWLKESTMADGALHPPSQKTQPMFKHFVLVHLQHVLDHKNYEGRDYLADIFPMSLERIVGTSPAPFRDGSHCFFGSRGRAGGLNLHSFR
ncbi:hypothetical protein ACQ4PT_007354 [Festuca glaucescens]